MSILDDTTIVHRGSIDTLKDVQKQTKALLEQGGYYQQKDAFYQLSDDYKERGISPGGSADMLVIKLIYEDVKHLLKQI